MKRNTSILLALFLTAFAATSVSANDRDDQFDDIDAIISCDDLVSLPPQNSIEYYRRRLPDPGAYRFNKKQLLTLFQLRERARLDRESLTMIERPEESAVVGIILRRRVELTEIFSLKEINEKILFGAFQRLAYKFVFLHLAKRPNDNFDELIQAAMIGLHAAILEYDSAWPWMFSTVAFNRMRREIGHSAEIEESPWYLRISGGDYKAILAIRASLISQHGRNPTYAEIVEVYNARFSQKITEGAVKKNLEKKRMAAATDSVGKTAGADSQFDSDQMFFQVISTLDLVEDESAKTIDEIAMAINLNESLASTLSTLLPREITTLEMRYGFDLIKVDGTFRLVQARHDGMTLEQVGLVQGVTRERIRQIEAYALRKLKHPSRKDLIREYYY